MIVTFDFDGTLWRWGFDPNNGAFSRPCGPDPIAIGTLKHWRKKGASIYIVTSRGSSTRNEVDDFTDSYGDLIDGVHYTEGCWKSQTLATL